MFVEAQSPLPLPFSAVHAALDAALADGGLTEESRRAAEEGASFLMRVGPGGSRGFAKQVLVEVLPFDYVGRKVVVPLRWQPTGPAGRLFPSLEANLTISEVDASGSLVSIVASYEPPLDAVGAGLDRMLLSRAAGATLTALLREIVTKLNTTARLLAPAARGLGVATDAEASPASRVPIVDEQRVGTR
ncbi:MAG TPA: hypothetical protein VIJ96_15085 [Acidothermaceae bacterium]